MRLGKTDGFFVEPGMNFIRSLLRRIHDWMRSVAFVLLRVKCRKYFYPYQTIDSESRRFNLPPKIFALGLLLQKKRTSDESSSLCETFSSRCWSKLKKENKMRGWLKSPGVTIARAKYILVYYILKSPENRKAVLIRRYAALKTLLPMSF